VFCRFESFGHIAKTAMTAAAMRDMTVRIGKLPSGPRFFVVIRDPESLRIIAALSVHWIDYRFLRANDS
jgi:hypothetical protein